MIVVLLDVIIVSQAVAGPVPVHQAVSTNQAAAEPVLALVAVTICQEAVPVPVRQDVSINREVAVPVRALAAVSTFRAAELVPVLRAAVIRNVVHLNI